jgi:hypothetical protein
LSALQKALVFDKQNDASRATVDEELKRAVAVATDNKVVPSDALVAELRQLSRARPGKQVDYKELLQVVWDEKLMEMPKRDVKPGRSEYLKYLFLVGNSAGCYNDNIEPKPSLFGVKKGSSSVRYSLFTNNDVDLSTTFKLVPEQMMKAVDDDMKVSVSYHPTTGRPLDPWLSYLAVTQGKKCDQRPTDQVFSRPPLVYHWHCDPVRSEQLSARNNRETKTKTDKTRSAQHSTVCVESFFTERGSSPYGATRVTAFDRIPLHTAMRHHQPGAEKGDIAGVGQLAKPFVWIHENAQSLVAKRRTSQPHLMRTSQRHLVQAQ